MLQTMVQYFRSIFAAEFNRYLKFIAKIK